MSNGFGEGSVGETDKSISQTASDRVFGTRRVGPTGIVKTGLDGAIRYASDPWCQIAGLARNRVIGTPWVECVHRDDLPAVARIWDRACSAIEDFESEFRLAYGGDSQRWTTVVFAVERDADGAAVGYLGTFIDVTAFHDGGAATSPKTGTVAHHKQIEDELRLTKERYDYATAIGKVGTWDWDPATGQLAWSDETFRLMGFAPSSITPTYELYLGLVHPDDRDFLNAAVEAALSERRPYDLDCRIVLADGRNLVCHVTGSVEFNDEGQPVRMLGTIQDVTERKHIEDELKLAKERQQAALESVLDSMVDGVLMLDCDGTVTRANRAAVELLSQPGRDLVGTLFRELFVDPEMAPTLEPRTSLRDLQLVLRGGDDAAVALTANLSPQQAEEGDPLGFVVVLHDDRQLRQARAQLQITDRLATMGTLAAGVAHEINNPLSYVVANLDFVAEELAALQEDPTGAADSVADLREAVRASQDGAQRVRNIVHDLRALSRTKEDTSSEISLTRVVDSAINMLRREIRAGVRLERELSETPAVIGNEGKLLQVMLNLLQNAFQSFAEAGRSEPQVWVRSGTTDDGSAFVEVQDNGTGIPPEVQAHIFDAFFTTKREGEGTGLGLSISHKIITSFGGTLRVSSRVGEGSTFRVVLPASAGE